MNIEQIHNNEVEYQIFACIILKSKILDEINLDEKFFKNKKILKYFKTLFERYGYVDQTLIFSNTNMPKNALNFIVKCINYEINYKNIYGYYKQLKNNYYVNKINELHYKLLNDEIDYKNYCEQINLMIDTDDNNNLLLAEDIEININIEREYTNISELDYLLKGIEYGKLSLWSGITNHGKTTLMIQFAKECLRKHKKIFYFSGEQTATEFKNYLYVGMCSKQQLEFIQDKYNSKIYDTKPKKEVIDYFDNIYKSKLHIYNNNSKDNTIFNMIKTMNNAYKLGVRIFFIDNFMQLDNSEKLEE